MKAFFRWVIVIGLTAAFAVGGSLLMERDLFVFIMAMMGLAILTTAFFFATMLLLIDDKED